MACHNIMAILVNKRSKNVEELQKVLTKYGCHIKARVGLHEAGDVCSEEGLIILQLGVDKIEIDEFNNKLNSLDGITSKIMEICS